MNVHKIHTAN